MKVNSWQIPMSGMYNMWNNNKTLTHYSMTKAQITIYNVLKGQKKRDSFKLFTIRSWYVNAQEVQGEYKPFWMVTYTLKILWKH